jgi:hypothetical protein
MKFDTIYINSLRNNLVQRGLKLGKAPQEIHVIGDDDKAPITTDFFWVPLLKGKEIESTILVLRGKADHRIILDTHYPNRHTLLIHSGHYDLTTAINLAAHGEPETMAERHAAKARMTEAAVTAAVLTGRTLKGSVRAMKAFASAFESPNSARAMRARLKSG